MLKLKDIKKTYTIGKKDDQQIVNALNGISLEFREHEFVSILGQSGCGKTTLLNIVGGLDKYTSGDLIINGISTKEYKDKDWDSYRNHRVGFIFQSYNLIPHLTVLQNVELALTLSGISKKERQERAKEVLKRVGLEDRINNKPNQLSGGQMQRVAIARALVNDPEIILADEPTGALDSKTSVQIMELLKKISDDKLIIMVTHNPELAQIYSSRIISLKDGCIIDDSMPYSSRLENKKMEDQLTDVEIIQNEVDAKNLEENKNSEIAQKEKSNVESAENVIEELNANEKNQNKKNKKKRMSFFTALSLSFKNLITKKARTILVSIAGSIGIIGIALILAVSSGFKGYIDKVQEETLSNYPLTIQSSTLDYTTIMTSLMGGGKEEDPKHELDGIYADTSLLDIMKEITSKTKTNDLQKFYAHLQENYDDIKPYINDIQYGYDVSIDVFNKNNFQVAPTSPAMYDIVLSFCVGYLENESIDKEAGDNVKGLDIVLNADGSYTLNLNTEASSVAQDRADAIVKQYLDENSANEFIQNNTLTISEMKLASLITKFVGVNISMFKAYDIGAVSPMMNNIDLIKSQYKVIAKTSEYEDKDVLSNLKNNQAVLVLDKNSEIDDYILYALGLLNKDQLMQMQAGESDTKIDYIDVLNSFNEYKVLVDTDYYVDLENNKNYVNLKSETYYNELNSRLSNMINNSTNSIEIVAVLRATTDNGCLSTGINYNSKYIEDIIAYYNSSVAVTGIYNGEDVTISEGKVSELKLDKPNTISFYFKSFEDKDKVVEFIEDYNKNCEDGKKITYNDLTGLIMSSVTTIINAITYVLVAFVSISLIVSSIMIGIITYISVIERTKEIGVLRSIGASKRDIKRVFTAESLIIGFASGALGIIVSLLLTIPINLVIKSFTSISNMAVLSPIAGTVLVLISMGLTFIAGLLPAKIASKKDPVVALRTE